MLKVRFYFCLVLILAFFYSCSSDNPAGNNGDPPNSEYAKILTAESGNLKFEVWSSTANYLRYGYNKVGFKVFENNQEKNTGFVKYFPKMYHWTNSPWHTTPVKSQFQYDASKGFFTGYVIYLMVTDSSSFWYGFYNYNNQLNVDSVMFNVAQYNDAQVRAFTDFQAGLGYFITLVKPYYPRQGLNTFQCMLHKTADYVYFDQVNDAQMYIMPWMDAMGHGSTNNVHPVHIGDGIYEGTVNFNMSGSWSVYDTVYYQNRKITPNTPPKFSFEP